MRHINVWPLCLKNWIRLWWNSITPWKNRIKYRRVEISLGSFFNFYRNHLWQNAWKWQAYLKFNVLISNYLNNFLNLLDRIYIIKNSLNDSCKRLYSNWNDIQINNKLSIFNYLIFLKDVSKN